MKTSVASLLAALAVCAPPTMPGAGPAANQTHPLPRAEQLKSQRWGMFICWSFSTFSGREWTPGVTNVSFFNPSGCDVEQWARTAKEAEMGYIVLLTKHHDGFCLWDTQTTDRKVTKSPLGRDVLRELRSACDRHGLKLALCFSEGDWTWPGAVDGQRGPAAGGRNPEMKKAQLRELLTGYGPIEFIWFDHAVGDGGLSHAETIKFVKSLQPDCFVGFNTGEQAGADIRLGERGRAGGFDEREDAGEDRLKEPANSYRLVEFTYPILPPHQGGADWFYSLPEHDNLCLPADKIFCDYHDALKFGNLLSLDVGPDYAGRLREVDARTLREVGGMIRATGMTGKAKNTYRNPLLREVVMADPHVIRVGGKYYLYATTHTKGYDAYVSDDLVHWENKGAAFDDPRRGAWAPDVFHNRRGDGKFYLYYTDNAPGKTQQLDKQIGVAVADSPLGPFRDQAVLATNAIDAHLFQDDDGKFYLYYVDLSGGFKIRAQPMSDPLAKSGDTTIVIRPTEAWEKISGHVTEGPFMLKRNSVYYLTYSGTGADSPNYGIGYATAKSPLGPFTKFVGNPIAHRGGKVLGPGHHCVIEGPDKKLWLVYHQKWDDGKNFRRFLAIDPLWFDDQGVMHATVTRETDEPAP